MKFLVLMNEFEDDFPARREEFREAHFRFLQAAIDRGELVLAGHFSDPLKGAFGDGMLVFAVPDRSVVETFAREDPYALNGLIKSWTIKSWNAVISPRQWSDVRIAD